jgi:hypothetical protein
MLRLTLFTTEHLRRWAGERNPALRAWRASLLTSYHHQVVQTVPDEERCERVGKIGLSDRPILALDFDNPTLRSVEHHDGCLPRPLDESVDVAHDAILPDATKARSARTARPITAI